ncbi:MAG: putative nucleotidyltransferase component of viral defense system [Halioglobus sp.]|jgi:predicted nucleotidyltransferase component of viral defense system
MIDIKTIEAWKEIAPWQQMWQTEQDLIISRCLVAIFSDEYLNEHLAFRGGTALHKLYLQPAPRYSEDIDLVQIKPEPIKPIMQRLNEVIDFFELPRNTKHGGHGIKAVHRFHSELENIKLRLKIEINCKEHSSVFPLVKFPYEVKSDWFNGSCNIHIYDIHELLGTKLRALYKKKKGRDLFDLDYARRHLDLDMEKIIHCFKSYITDATGKRPPSQKEFIINIKSKIGHLHFDGDMEAILRSGVAYDQTEAWEWLQKSILPLI